MDYKVTGILSEGEGAYRQAEHKAERRPGWQLYKGHSACKRAAAAHTGSEGERAEGAASMVKEKNRSVFSPKDPEKRLK